MKKIGLKIILLIIAVLFVVGTAFGIILHNSKINVSNIENTVDYYINGEGEHLRFGVEGDDNLFEPNEKINVVLECLDEELSGTKAIVLITSEQTGFSKWGYVTFDYNSPYNILSFSSQKNGIFTIKIKQFGKDELSFTVGVLPKNEQASDAFYYGVQPYITRAYTWGEGFCVPGYNAEDSVDKILDTAEYLGANLVREDSVGWGAMQSEPYGDLNFTTQDYLVKQVNSHGMKYNWLLGYNAGEWSAAKEYKKNYDEAIGWTYPPDIKLWDDFTNKVADHYADNTDILWEIWNEPNWYFFAGPPEEYFELLESTSKTLKSKNKSAYVYSGGLAAAEKETNSEYYQKSAELTDKGLLNNFGYHNHEGLDNYYDYMAQMLNITNQAGLKVGGFNSESGVGGTDASTIACKALYTRSTGAKGFVSFAFRKTVTPENDINDFAFFNEYLQPTEAVISYATVIHFLGNADFVKNISNDKNLVIDEYTKNGNKIEVYYSLGDKNKIAAPDGNYIAYDMYGNPIEIGEKITVSNSPIYIVY
ncbi:MAG: hypothetical protein IJ025_05190 [Clostridia bacterium]|nr:hypothetical protein [Clostridia bacterium]